MYIIHRYTPFALPDLACVRQGTEQGNGEHVVCYIPGHLCHRSKRDACMGMQDERRRWKPLQQRMVCVTNSQPYHVMRHRFGTTRAGQTHAAVVHDFTARWVRGMFDSIQYISWTNSQPFPSFHRAFGSSLPSPSPKRPPLGISCFASK